MHIIIAGFRRKQHTSELLKNQCHCLVPHFQRFPEIQRQAIWLSQLVDIFTVSKCLQTAITTRNYFKQMDVC